MSTNYPHCKINIGLNIVGKRPDGYHNLETIFYPIPLHDELTIEESSVDSLDIEGTPLDGDWTSNLVVRAMNLLRQEGFHIPPQRIHLRKNIPCGAGLGGGSSDAAFMMKMLNTNYQLGLKDQEMEQLLSGLGADCPFFIKTKPFFAEGIGNLFTPIDLSLSGWHLALVKPNDHISTKEAYAGVTPQRPATHLLTAVASNVEDWKESVRNDFEASILPAHPAIAQIKETLYAEGAIYASMSGSGSSVYGLFREPSPVTQQTFPDCFVHNCVL
ncbi:MAG: 4-(cytidine 5'-diphospho)-2-C-methyl-D-erythritol kinase [Bacteroidaceae bacterium]|nr:4-(cytidine 5'-diphospho)-2-C-methyl-D-erythritol kinase [Bacteroidaceae bacterium]